jgi:hypothetical protein
MNPLVRTTVAAVLLAVPVVVQIVLPDAVDRAAGHLAFAASQLVAWLLVATVVRSVPVPARRRARVGRVAVLAGVTCQVLFSGAYGVSAADGEPLEASFVLFLLGFLLLVVGGIAWGSALLRSDATRTAGAGLIAVGVLGLLAMLVGVDPLHDVFLVASYVAWLMVGAGLPTPASGGHLVSERSLI